MNKRGVSRERSVALIALFAAMIAALGLIPPIMLFGGVPVTAQSLGIMLCGTILGASRGAAAVLLFVLLVAAGLPLLSGGRGGLGLFVSPSSGFLLGFPLAALVTGAIMERVHSFPILISSFVAAVTGCIVVLYIPGILGWALFGELAVTQAAYLSMAFLPGDLIKAVLAAIITSALARTRPDQLVSRL